MSAFLSVGQYGSKDAEPVLDQGLEPLQREAERDRPRFTSDRGVIRLAGSRRMSPRERDAERIAAALRRDGPLTRGELSKRLAISASLVSRAAAWEADQDAPRFASDRNPRTARYALTDG